MALERKIAIIGAAGMLGHALQEVFPEAFLFDINHTSQIQNIDITDLEIAQQALRGFTRGDVVINAAAYTNVDGAETREGMELSRVVNVVSAKNLATMA